MKLSWRLAIVASACLFSASGCNDAAGPKRKLVKVTGTVQFDGKPLTQGTISFVAEGQGAVNAAGDIDGTGKYTLSTHEKGDGAPPGNYKVRIESWASPPKMDETGTDPGKAAIPEKYFDVNGSGLTATVKDGSEPQVIDFTLMP